MSPSSSATTTRRGSLTQRGYPLRRLARQPKRHLSGGNVFGGPGSPTGSRHGAQTTDSVGSNPTWGTLVGACSNHVAMYAESVRKDALQLLAQGLSAAEVS